MAKVPPRGKGVPPAPVEVVGNLERGETSNLGFRVPILFKKEFAIFAKQHDYKNQTDMLYAMFDLLKQKHAAEK